MDFIKLMQLRKEISYPQPSASTSCPPQLSSSPSLQAPPLPSTSRTPKILPQLAAPIRQKSPSLTNNLNLEASLLSNQNLICPVPPINCQSDAINTNLTSSLKKSPTQAMLVECQKIEKHPQPIPTDKQIPKVCQSLTINCQAHVVTAPPMGSPMSLSPILPVSSSISPIATQNQTLLVVRSQTIAAYPASTESSFRKTSCWTLLNHQTKKSMSSKRISQIPVGFSTHCSQVIQILCSRGLSSQII